MLITSRGDNNEMVCVQAAVGRCMHPVPGWIHTRRRNIGGRGSIITEGDP